MIRFRLDGIVRASTFSSSSNMLPYSPKGFHFYKHRILLTNLIPGNGYSFPNNTLTPLERVNLLIYFLFYKFILKKLHILIVHFSVHFIGFYQIQ